MQLTNSVWQMHGKDVLWWIHQMKVMVKWEHRNIFRQFCKLVTCDSVMALGKWQVDVSDSNEDEKHKVCDSKRGVELKFEWKWWSGKSNKLSHRKGSI